MFAPAGVDPFEGWSPMELIAKGLARLAAEERSTWSAGARSDHLVDILAAGERMRAEAIRCAADWDAVASWAHDAAPSAPGWLMERTAMTRPEAVRFVRTARHVRANERTEKALRSGDVTVAHVEVLASVARGRERHYTEHEDALLRAAEAVTPEDLVTVARRWRELADDELSRADAAANFERRHLHVSKTTGGGVIHGFIDPEATAYVIAALDATQPPDPTDGPEPPRSLAQRRADAVVTICAGAVGATAPTTRARANVDIVLDADTALGRAPTDLLHARCEIRGGGALSKAAIERILCDSPVGYAVVRRAVARAMAQAPSEVLDLGRRRRDPSPAQRRAVLLRDECCQYPGCRAPVSWCDIHHLDPWEHGGSTDLRDLVAVCRRHHVAVHEGGRRLARAPDGGVVLAG